MKTTTQCQLHSKKFELAKAPDPHQAILYKSVPPKAFGLSHTPHAIDPKPAVGQAPKHRPSASQLGDRCMPDGQKSDCPLLGSSSLQQPRSYTTNILETMNILDAGPGDTQEAPRQALIRAELVPALRRAQAGPCGLNWAPWNSFCDP